MRPGRQLVEVAAPYRPTHDAGLSARRTRPVSRRCARSGRGQSALAPLPHPSEGLRRWRAAGRRTSGHMCSRCARRRPSSTAPARLPAWWRIARVTCASRRSGGTGAGSVRYLADVADRPPSDPLGQIEDLTHGQDRPLFGGLVSCAFNPAWVAGKHVVLVDRRRHDRPEQPVRLRGHRHRDAISEKVRPPLPHEARGKLADRHAAEVRRDVLLK